jgi:uncharacterized protein YyaL (SSP411 family)
MSRLRGKTTATLLIVIFMVSAFTMAIPVSADGVYLDEIIQTADRLVALQSPDDYGWDWIVTSLTGHSGNPSAANMYGVVILGLLDAYEATGTPSYLDAATGMADHMIQGDASIGEFSKHVVGTATAGAYDYQFLMRCARVHY